MEDLVPATERTSMLQCGRKGGEKEKEKEKEREIASRKREIARLEVGARADGDADGDVKHTPAKRRDRTTRLPRPDRGDAGGRSEEKGKHKEQRRHTVSGYGGDVVDEFVPATEDARMRVVNRQSGAERRSLEERDGDDDMGAEGGDTRMETPTARFGAEDWGARLRPRE